MLLNNKKYKPATECVLVQTPIIDPYNSSSLPVYITATFKQNSLQEMGDYDYSRSGNPSRTHLESHLAKLEHASNAFVVNSGMTALDVILRLVSQNHEIIVGLDIYGGTHRLLNFIKNQHESVRVLDVDTTDPACISRNLSINTRLVLLETPTNPMMKIADIKQISEIVHEKCPDALVVVDNTMMSPYLLLPLEMGADIVYHSATKFLSGHHDLMAGVVAVKDPDLAKKIAFTINATGVGLPPFDCFLLLRGVKTLSIRIDKQQSNAIKIAQFLEMRGFKVNYPGLKSHPQHELHSRMAKGPGAVLSFQTGDIQKSIRIVEEARLWTISVSFGCINSLISMPCKMSHASIPEEIRKERALPEDLIRLCVGIEDAEDLIDDLNRALMLSEIKQL